jgi:ribosomal protein S18 acetylase RimI-like enzyme
MKKIILRTAKEADAEIVWKTLSSQPKIFYRYIHGLTKETVDSWYPKEKIDISKSYPINVFELTDSGDEAGFLGNAIFLFHSPLSHRGHIAKYGFGVIPEYQGLGIGKALLEFALGVIKDFSDIKKIQTEVVCENYPAINLYMKSGFKIEGHRLKSWALDDKYFDTYIMGLFL